MDTPNNVLKLKLVKHVETTLKLELPTIDVLPDDKQHLTFSIAIENSEEHEACRPFNLASDIKIEILNMSGDVIKQTGEI